VKNFVNSIKNKKIFGVVILFLTVCVMIAYTLGAFGVNAYDKGEDVLLTSNSLTKRLNIMQSYSPNYPAVPYLIKPVAFDTSNQLLPTHNDLFFGADDNNFIFNLQYSNRQSFALKKEYINDFIEKSYDTSKVSTVKIFWGAYSVYFPIVFKWSESGIYDCVKAGK